MRLINRLRASRLTLAPVKPITAQTSAQITQESQMYSTYERRSPICSCQLDVKR